jgi:hypothetical protein
MALVPSKRRSEVARLVPLVLAALASIPAAQASPARRLAEIEERLRALQEPWYRDLHAARAGDERDALLDRVPGREVVPELVAVAEEARTLALRGTDSEGDAQSSAHDAIALRAWTRLFGLGKELRDEELAARALRRIVADHIDSAELEGLCSFIGSWSRPGKTAASEAALRALIAGSPHRAVRAAAHFHLAVILSQAEPSPEREAEARALLVALRDDYGDLGGWKGVAAGGLYELEHLRVGHVAPDFEAVDQARVPFRLSEYRGRVVLLHFWGFW